MALKADGTVVAWGNNWYGQIEVPGTIQGSVRAVSAGVFYSVALLKDGSVVAWGKNEYGQSTVPAGAKTNVVAIAAGGVHVAALKADGSVITWGLGNTATVPVFQGMSAIATGRFHTLGLKLLAFLVLPLDLGCGLYRLADPRHNGARRFRGAAARLCCRRGCSG